MTTTYPLRTLDIDQLLAIVSDLRSAEEGAASMEAAAEDVVELLWKRLVDDEGEPACVLVRYYVTQAVAALPPALQRAAEDLLPADDLGALTDETRCFTLLATRGTEPAWCDRRRSAGHAAIPLVTEDLVRSMPMLNGLLSELGVKVSSVVRPDSHDRVQRHHRRYDVFHVEDAVGSPFVPAKDFVERYAVRSAVGIGGVLPSGELFCVLLFSRVVIDAHVAELLGTLAVTVKAGMVPHTFRVFAR